MYSETNTIYLTTVTKYLGIFKKICKTSGRKIANFGIIKNVNGQQLGNLNVIKMFVRKWIFGFSATPIKTPTGYFVCCFMLGNL